MTMQSAQAFVRCYYPKSMRTIQHRSICVVSSNDSVVTHGEATANTSKIANRSGAISKRLFKIRQLRQSSSDSSSNSSGDSSITTIVLDPLVVCGPSGVGKGSIIDRFMNNSQQQKQIPQFGFSVSHTTRKPRPGELDGVHYHFVDQQRMQALISRQDFFVEWAEVHGNFYGTSWQALQAVQASGRKILLDIDVQGVQRLKQMQRQHSPVSTTASTTTTARQNLLFCPKYVFIAPPSLNTLHDRLRQRATETEEALQTRLANAASEVTYGTWPGNFDAVVVNNDLDRAVQEFEETVRRLYNVST